MYKQTHVQAHLQYTVEKNTDFYIWADLIKANLPLKCLSDS